jgi:hypothetical protein
LGQPDGGDSCTRSHSVHSIPSDVLSVQRSIGTALMEAWPRGLRHRDTLADLKHRLERLRRKLEAMESVDRQTEGRG